MPATQYAFEYNKQSDRYQYHIEVRSLKVIKKIWLQRQYKKEVVRI